ncbi:MAG: BCCT family transporter, partial [Brevibacterium aurantiacum]
MSDDSTPDNSQPAGTDSDTGANAPTLGSDGSGSLRPERRASRDKLKADARRVSRETGKNLGKLDYSRPRHPSEDEPENNTQYPHNTHPILVPGIAIDEQRRRYSLDKVIFAVAGTLTVAFVIWGIVDSDGVSTVATAAYNWSTLNVGWFFN